MTTSRTLRKRLKRLALFCLMAASSVGPMTQHSFASETHDSGGLCGWIESLDDARTEQQESNSEPSAPSHLSPPFLAVNAADELVIDTCSYDAWLAATLDRSQTPRQCVEDAIADKASMATDLKTKASNGDDSSGFNAAIAAIAAAATAGNPIPFSQWTEPFAMVGPTNSHSTGQIQQFQAWFDHGKHVAGDFVPLVDFDGNVDPVENLAPSDAVVAVEEDAVETVAVPDATENPLVGSSVVIATIRESYRPYDLAERDEIALNGDDDLRSNSRDDGDAEVAVVWSDGLFSPPRQPLCHHVFERLRNPGWSPLAEMVESPREPSADPMELGTIDAVASAAQNSAVTEQSSEIPAAKIQGSADCLLDEWVWKMSVTLEEESVTENWLRPERIGGQMASLVVNGDQVATKVASELATVWPVVAKPLEPKPGIGARLLARAEAAERSTKEGPAKPSDAELLARADALLLQWVDVAQSVIDDVSNRINDVTEVARNRGTQVDSTRR